MRIELKEGVFWDTETTQQSDEAKAWLREEVYTKLAHNRNMTDLVQPVYDDFDRPVRWIIVTSSVSVTVDRNYIKPDSGSWAWDNDMITVNTI